MPILIITEKTSQARDLRAALGDRVFTRPIPMTPLTPRASSFG